MIRVVIADDHPIVRQGLRRILADRPDLNLVGEVSTTSELLRLLARESPDVLVLDLSMPEVGGFEALREIRRTNPQLAVLILSLHPESRYAVRALRAGAAGYLSKESIPESLVEAVRTVAAGDRYVSPQVAQLLAQELVSPLASEARPRHESLSQRELQVLSMMCTGQSLTEIARALRVTPKTISTYRSRVLEKMGMQTNAELIRYACEHDL